MKVELGHLPEPPRPRQASGCFRCHDEQHRPRTAETISQDCGLCHSLLAQEEKDPEILKKLVD